MKIKQIIALIIEGRRCSIHGKHPIVNVTHREIKIAACCKAFHAECVKQVSAILTGIDATQYWKVA